MKTSRRPASGFTLLEILVVLAIIGILASILFAVFARVREQGRRTTYENNLHQIGLAFQQYVSGNDGLYPPSSYYTTAGEVRWSEMLQPYLKSTQVFDCSSHTERFPSNRVGSPYSPEFVGDYFYEWPLLLNGQLSPNVGNKSEMQISDPTHNPVIFDAGWIDFADNTPHYLERDGKGSEQYPEYAHSVHNGGANFAFADGHVKWLSVQQQGIDGVSLWAGHNE